MNLDYQCVIYSILNYLHQDIPIIIPTTGVDARQIVDKAIQSQGNIGYNAAEGKFEDLVLSGVVDPTKVRSWGGCYNPF